MKYYLLLFALLMGCGEKERPFERPFVIIDKGGEYYGQSEYTYVDKNGRERVFADEMNKYSIGDTIGAKPDLHRDWMRELSEKQNTNIGK